MGQKIILTCDLHGDNTEATETVRFTVGADTYEIELCNKHRKEFADRLAPFIGGARHVSGTRRTSGARRSAAKGRRPAPRKSGGSVDVAAVREWARQAGYEINSRGRIPGAILAEYAAAKKKS